MSTEQSPFTHIEYADEDKIIFYQTLREAAKDFGCHYMSYVYESDNKGVRVGFTSNPDWQHEYIDNDLINYCHLWQTVSRYFTKTQRGTLILPWDTVKPEDRRQKEMILYRDEMNVGRNGISFCTQGNGEREFIAFAPSTHEPNFTHHVLNHMDTIRKITMTFRSTSERTLENKEEYV